MLLSSSITMDSQDGLLLFGLHDGLTICGEAWGLELLRELDSFVFGLTCFP